MTMATHNTSTVLTVGFGVGLLGGLIGLGGAEFRLPLLIALFGSVHEFKYRLAYVVDGLCVVRYDNEAGKGDHRHFGEKESAYTSRTPEKLITDFERDIARWNRENRNS